jgi:hypothetical protein
MAKLFGVVVECGMKHNNKPCAHLVSAEKNYFDAWANVPPKFRALDGHTVLVGANAIAVRELRKKNAR